MTQRDLPSDVAESLERLRGAPTPIEAVAATRSLRDALGRWQSVLVAEAIDAGASWEDLGGALATTRQAAWARFRHVLGSEGGSVGMKDREQQREQLRQLRTSAQERLRELDEQWRSEQAGLRAAMEQTQHRLTEAKRRHASERLAVKQDLRRSVEEAKTRTAP